jgi:hypothetical protein
MSSRDLAARRMSAPLLINHRERIGGGAADSPYQSDIVSHSLITCTSHISYVAKNNHPLLYPSLPLAE